MFGNGEWVIYKAGRTSILGWISEAKVIASNSSNEPIKTMYQFYTKQRVLNGKQPLLANENDLQTSKARLKEVDIRALQELALLTKDKQWFMELSRLADHAGFKKNVSNP
ncbi:hypothetical protein [Bacillus sp. Marseille-P3800]|uniref:hypothetical protein n=1 Tax=Bacillus sp. Marseille-P3800 TaxID=2014782 RepID=UPI000C083ACD|nr:hypothetical protein [Bacillus sp. Marseille-P3800]